MSKHNQADFCWPIVAPRNGSREQIDLMNARIIAWIPNGLLREVSKDAELSRYVQDTVFNEGTSIAQIFRSIIKQ